MARNRWEESPQLLLLHGVLRNWRSFYSILPELNLHFSIAALSFRGHGGSSRCPGRYRAVDYVDDVAHLAASFDRPLVVYGHSLGAMVALAFAAKHPALATAVIAEDPPFQTMGARLRGGPLDRYFREVERCLAKSSGKNADELFEEFSNLVVEERPDGTQVRVRDQRDEQSRRFSTEALAQVDSTVLAPINSGKWLEGYDLPHFAERLRCPVKFLQSDRRLGGMLDEVDLTEFEKSLADNCVVRRFPGVGHSIHWSRPNEILDIVRETLRAR